MKFTDLLNQNSPIIADGGMGTMLFNLGLLNGDSPELWNVVEPQKIKSVHQAYVEAGAQIILTNTFGCNRIRLDMHDLGERVAELNAAAAQLAREVADQADHPVVVAGSMGPTGSILEPYGDLSFDAAVEIFKEQAQALIENGVDVIWTETMAALEEVQAAIQAIKSIDPTFPIVSTMTFDTHGHTMMGVSPEQAVAQIASFGATAIGANCGNGSQEVETVIQKMHIAAPTVTLVAKANAGLPRLEDDVAIYDASPDDMAGYAQRVRTYGATIVGACCGSTPEHIRAIATILKQ